MSTRCHIFIEDPEFGDFRVILYRHSDGYPEFPGVVPDLAEFLGKFMAYRGWDPEYIAAQLMHFMIAKASAHMLEVMERCYVKDDEKPSLFMQRILDNDGNDFLGYGVCTEVHWDIEYAYVIKKTGVEVYEVGEAADRSTWKRLNTDRQAKRILEGKCPRKWKEKKDKQAA